MYIVEYMYRGLLLCRVASQLDPEAMAYKFYGWLRALCGWLAGLTKQATAVYGLGIERRLTVA